MPEFVFEFIAETEIIERGVQHGQWENIVKKMRKKIAKQRKKWDILDLMIRVDGELLPESRWVNREGKIDEYL